MCVFALYFFEPYSSTYFEYQRQGVENGELWRLITANLVHTNFAHLVLNSAGLFMIWLIQAEHFSSKRFSLVFLLCALCTGVGIHMLSSFASYAGLSGALHGVISYGAVKDIEQKLKFGKLLLLGIVVKVGYEQIVGGSESLKQLIGANVAVDAHLYGMLSGIGLALIGLLLSTKQKATTPVHGKSD